MRSLYATISAFALLGTALGQFNYASVVNGKTVLTGSSFGVPTVNATYDYVVSHRLFCSALSCMAAFSSSSIQRFPPARWLCTDWLGAKVVGGGLSGLVMAERLAENPNVSVAVVEAGSFYELSNGNISQIPQKSPYFSTPEPTDIQPGVDWGLVTLPQPVSEGMRKRRCCTEVAKTKLTCICRH